MFNNFSERQKDVLKQITSDKSLVLSEGAIRSGKTVANGLGFTLWHLREGMEHESALIGQSVESALRNVGYNLIDYYNSLGAFCELKRDIGTYLNVEADGKTSKIWVFGSDNERSFRKIQGSTLKGMLVEECTLLPESMWTQAWGRLSVEGSKCFGSYNTDSPHHWFKKKVRDRVETYNGVVHKFLQKDNPSLSEEIKARYEASYTDHWYSRFILGEWAGASGLIFPNWTAENQEDHNGKFTLSLDWGSSSVFCILAFDTLQKRTNVFSELYFDARESQPRTEQEHIEATKGWIQGINKTLRGTIIYVDPSTPKGFQKLLRQEGAFVRNADNQVLAGLSTTSTQLANSSITIGNCPKLKEELNSYSWDDNATDKGEDKPLKKNDHACDALRYFIASSTKTGRVMRATSTREALGR